MILRLVFTVITFIVLNIIWICYIPLNIIRLFYKRQICSPITNDILFLPAHELAERIRKREVTSEAVVRSYIERISEVNPLLNAVIEERFEKALKESKQVEETLNASSDFLELKKKYPLLGVPFTVKGSLALEGLDHSAGVKSKKRVASKNAVVVQKLIDAGAIPLLVSNVPEFCMNLETANKLIGKSNNPYDSRRTCGGSSGGEGALISAAASIIGLGSDIAGSLRIPTHYCGVWGHKATPKVISIDGHYPNSTDKEWADLFQVGPISRYASDLSMMFELLVESDMKKNLHDAVDLKQVKVYYLKDITNNILLSRTNVETKDAVQSVVNYFKKFSEKSSPKEIKNDKWKYASELSLLKLHLLENVDNLFEGKGEGAHMELLRYLCCMSESVFIAIVYGLIRWWIWIIPESHKQNSILTLQHLKRELLEVLDDSSVLIMPTMPQEAPFHNDFLKTFFDVGYCGIFNGLGLPSTACPVMQTKNGMPIGIQVIGAPFCDRLCLAVAEEIERAFGGWQPPSPSLIQNAAGWSWTNSLKKLWS